MIEEMFDFVKNFFFFKLNHYVPIGPWGPVGPTKIASKFGSYIPGSPIIPCTPGLPGRP